MNVYIDLSSRQPITNIGNSAPVPAYTVKSQDTAALNIYFVAAGTVTDLGASAVLKFGIVQTGASTLLVLDTVFTRQTDTNLNVYYQGFPVFNTSALLTALGSLTSINGSGEIRYQLPDGEITHCLDIPFILYRTILAETTTTTTTANFTQPAVGANVAIAVVTTSFLSAGDVVSIGTANDTYTVVSVTDPTHFSGENMGTGTTAPGSTISSGATVSLASPNVLSTYPDVSTIELKVHKDQPNGYPSLDASTLLLGSEMPVDNVTIQILDGQIASKFILAETTASFVTPAANANVTVPVVSSSGLVVGQYVRIPVAGYYIVESVPDGTHVTIQNNGDPANIASGNTIATDAPLMPAQAATSGSGTPGQNAFTTTTASFTVPASGGTVIVTMGSTAWLGGSGYIVFIQGAGYYSISSVTDSTHAVLTNLGYAATNAASGTVINSGATISPGGLQGPVTIASGANAYDTTQAGFTMPAAAASVNVTITNTNWLGIGQEVYIAGAGYFSVGSIVSATIFSATNSNYPGAATPGSTIASGAKVSPAGLIGPQGAGGAGLNAFTTLTSNFTQPAVSATVTAVVATTAWMTANLVIYVAGGGFYQISSVTDLTHVVLTNLGYTGNAAPAATVTGSGTQLIMPGGLIGPNGINAFTTTTTSFTMPAVSGSVTITVANTAFMTQSQNVYVGGAGYFSVSSITDGTHFVGINLGSSGNISSGSVVAIGAPVTTAGATGPQGPQGPAGATGATGGSGGGTGTTANPFDPRTQGYYLYEDFLWAGYNGSSLNNCPLEWESATQAGSSGAGSQFYTADLNAPWAMNATNRAQGIVILSTAATAASQGLCLARGSLGASGSGLTLGLGPFEMAGRIALYNSSLPASGNSTYLKMGLVQQGSAMTSGALPTTPLSGNPYQAIWMEYSPDNNSGNFRIGYCNGPNVATAPTFGNCASGTITAQAFHWWSFKVDATGTVTVYIDGTLIGTFTGVAPLGNLLVPFFLVYRGSAVTTNWQMYIDALYMYQNTTR